MKVRPRLLFARAFAFAWLVALAAAAPAFAQNEGKIAGTVRDQSGGFVAGATVLVKNERTGQDRTALSDAQGAYTVNKLAPASYTIRVVVGDFAPIEYTNMTLVTNQELNLDFELKPKGLSESVTVVAEVPVIDLSSARIGTNVIEREVKDLPINGRQLSQLYLQAPGSVNSGTGTFGDIRFSGRAVEQNMVRYDGVEGTAIIDASPGNLNGEVPSPFRLQSSLENVQEFRVESNSYPAEYGTGTGGQITVVSKSGGNDPHGSVFEYKRSDRLDAPNFFDLDGRKSPLSQNQFGGSMGGPIVKDRTFFFGSYEGYRLKAGINFVEAVPSASVRARAVPAVLPLLDAFKAANAVILPGKSTNPDFDIAQLQTNSTVNENAFSVRLDHQLASSWKVYGRFFRDNGTNEQPEGVSGRVSHIEANPQNGVVSLQGIFGSGVLNEAKFGYNSAETLILGTAPTVNGIDLSFIALNITGSVANSGIAGQGSNSGVSIPGGLLRQNSAANGHGTPYKPYSLSLMDNVSVLRGRHNMKLGGEVRLIRMTTDRFGGTTYSFNSLDDFLANRAANIQYQGTLSDPSPFNNGAAQQHEARQEYYIAFAQDEWRIAQNFTLNYGVRYDYYSPLHEAHNLDVIFDIDKGVLKAPDTPFYHSTKTNVQPRVSFTWSPGSQKTVMRGGFGLYVGPGQTEDQIQPIEVDRISITQSGGGYPVDIASLRANFVNSPNNRSYQPRAYANDYTIPERVYQYTLSVQRELPGKLVFTGAYVGSQGRNLFLRNFTNRIVSVATNPSTGAAIITREFDIVLPDGTIQRPYAEIDFKASGGHDNYNSMQLSLARRFNSGLTLNSQYTLARSYGNTAGSNEALTAGNPFDYDYDLGWNAFDVRHTYNISALYSLPIGRGRRYAGGIGRGMDALVGGWDIGAIVNGRSGLPIDVRITRPDVVFVDGAGNVFTTAAAGRTAIINTPGGGSSRNVRRPNLVPGVNPYLRNGLQWLNPAAFSTPAPGEFGDLKRGELRGPSFNQVDLVVAKKIAVAGRSNVEVRWELYNLANRDNFSNPVATLPAALGTNANQVQPNQPFSSLTAGNFGQLTSTVGRTVGIGTNRQMQFALRFSF